VQILDIDASSMQVTWDAWTSVERIGPVAAEKRAFNMA
jgi:hypothetical protein